MANDEKTLLSIGVDIGTSTMQMVFSRLSVKNRAAAYLIPDFQIIKKEIVYRSQIYFTPLKDKNTLDMTQIKNIVCTEYKFSGFTKDMVSTGAVIITGEAANKRNADYVVSELAEFAGDFVVAVAGPDLESALAGYGSGSAQLSADKNIVCANLDIGGGTTNIAVFKNGKIADLYGLHIGGRLIRFDNQGKVLYISPKIKPLLDECDISLNIGEQASDVKLRLIVNKMAEFLASILLQKTLSELQQKLRIYHANKNILIDICTVSGGVGELMNRVENDCRDCMIPFGDIGLYLARAIKQVFKQKKIKLVRPAECIRATVIGAGMHSMKLSGSTIYYDKELLPLRNIPVICLEKKLSSSESLAEQMRLKSSVYEEVPAFFLEGIQTSAYSEIKQLAADIWDFYRDNDLPMLIIVQKDIAKVLGQTLKIISQHSHPLICIDNITAQQGDYIDFCQTVGTSLMVTVKTLLFKN